MPEIPRRRAADSSSFNLAALASSATICPCTDAQLCAHVTLSMSRFTSTLSAVSVRVDDQGQAAHRSFREGEPCDDLIMQLMADTVGEIHSIVLQHSMSHTLMQACCK